ncbi:MAG: hypothetical protein ACHQYP_02070 [Nitrospiria bacterium]
MARTRIHAEVVTIRYFYTFKLSPPGLQKLCLVRMQIGVLKKCVVIEMPYRLNFNEIGTDEVHVNFPVQTAPAYN